MITLFRDESSDPKGNAQRNLSGRTHYVDEATLRFHHSRIIAAKACADGLLFAIVTSDAQDMQNTRRGFRYVIFDVFGTVVERNPASVDIEFFKTSDKARAARDKALSDIDAATHTLKAIAKARRDFEMDMEHLRVQVGKVAAKVEA